MDHAQMQRTTLKDRADSVMGRTFSTPLMAAEVGHHGF